MGIMERFFKWEIKVYKQNEFAIKQVSKQKSFQRLS